MPTRTKNAEMSKIVSNSEIHLHHCLCESSGFKIGKSNHQRCSVKKVYLKILQNWQKSTMSMPTLVFYWLFYKILENTFLTEHLRATVSDEEAWWSKLLIPQSFLNKIFAEIIGVFNSETCWKKSCVTVRVGHLGYVTCFSTRGKSKSINNKV